MLTAVVTRGAQIQVRLTSSPLTRSTVTQGSGEEEGHGTSVVDEEHTEEAMAEGAHSAEDGGHEEGHLLVCEFPEEDAEGNPITDAAGNQVCRADYPSPVVPEMKELAWGGGMFVITAVALAILVPKVMKGMKARYDLIEGGKAEADSMRAAARADVAQYDSSLATVKAEAHERVEAARQQLEAERSAKLAEVNEAIAAKRDAAAAETTAAREAVKDQVSSAVEDVTARTLELAIGKQPDAAKVRAAVDAAMSTGVSS